MTDQQAGHNVVDIFDEVDEELRADRAEALFKRFLPHILAGATLIVAGSAGWQGWKWWEARRDQAAATAFVTTMRAADALPADAAAPARIKVAEDFQKLATEAPAGYRALARLRAAALRAAGGDLPGALTLWNEVANDSSVDPILRDYAALVWVQHQVDGGDPAMLQARVAPLMAATNPWRAVASETAALIELRAGRTDQARAALKALAADTTAPDGVRARANGLLTQLGG